ncbi:hypothetical protein EJ04DRAFT_567786 [Polyplosphaeria fusca]|uniref:Extracellular membrane protein CFEM domain-containing protein n=1 Tax=Polyplosphaeria fusca TaxID=682080 RepID=A0A9P4QMY8_9PLEO|nr:hypothetical protein EJ04DRAFT_567786 [Polyplosphaeria fusca]
MHLFAVALVLLFACSSALAQESSTIGTITSSASLTCPTGEPKSKYDSCASSASAKIDDCDEDDLHCICNVANLGFSCLTSYCPTHTASVCAASYILDQACNFIHASVPSLTGISCVASDVPTAVQSLLTLLSSAEETSRREGSSESTTSAAAVTRSSESISAPSSTGAGNVVGVGFGRKRGATRMEGGGGDDGLLEVFLGMGIFVAVGVAGFAAYFYNSVIFKGIAVNDVDFLAVTPAFFTDQDSWCTNATDSQSWRGHFRNESDIIKLQEKVLHGRYLDSKIFENLTAAGYKARYQNGIFNTDGGIGFSIAVDPNINNDPWSTNPQSLVASTSGSGGLIDNDILGGTFGHDNIA